MYAKYVSLLLFVMSIAARVEGQNIPQLTESSTNGSITVTTAVPPVATTTSGINYIKSSAPMIPITDPSAISGAGDLNVKQTITYLDGFNRVYQSVKNNVAIVNNAYQHQVNIADSRFQNDQYTFLPYASEFFGLQPNAFIAQKNYYNNLFPEEGYTPFSKSTIISDASGTRNVNYAPGKSQVGQNRGAVTTGISNIAGEVRMWGVDGSGNPITTGTYAAGELFGEVISAPTASITNPFGSLSSKAFKDKDGRIILKMVADSSYVIGGGVSQNVTTYQSTYYVYDEVGQLRYTIPPHAVQLIEQASWNVSATVLNNLCFQHQYDKTGRLKAVRFPGEGGFTHFVYDHKDRVVMLQTPKDKLANQYQLTYYDKLDRVIATALYSNSDGPEAWQPTFDYPPGTSFSNSDIRHYMGFDKEGVIPGDNSIAGHQLITYHFYDNYEQTDPTNSNYTTYNNQLQFTELENTPAAEIPVRSFRTHGLLTGSKVKIFRAPGAVQISTGDGVWNHNYYDDKGRIIRSLQLDFSDQGGQIHYYISGTQYDFLNRPIISKSIFQNLFASTSIYKEFTKNEYQAGTGSLLQTLHKVNDGPWLVSTKYVYDALGRVKRKSLGSSGEIQDFSYNIRGQLTGINALYAETGNKGTDKKTFGESLKYDYGFSQPQYNGKIAGMVWRGGNGTVHAYGYDYDQAGRLKNAEYRTSGSTFWNKTSLDYTVSNVRYDKNGNLLSMDQRGVSPTDGVQTIDKLRYSYEDNELSNRLVKVADDANNYNLGDFVNPNGAASDYEYDLNGNLVKDNNKGISTITYTHFDKPQVISFTNGNRIEFSYDASGRKVQELLVRPGQPNRQIDYVGNYVYENNTLQYILNANGRTVRDSATNTFKEEFFVKDHLGNVRSTVDIIHKPLLQYLATYELASANLEGLLFEQLNEIRDNKPASTDPGDLKAGRLNGEDQRIGTSLLMHVMAGDQVEMNVNSFYDSYDHETDNPVSSDQMLASIVGTLTGGVGGFQGSEGHNPDMVQQLFTPENYLDQYNSIINTATDPSRPKAYLNYVLFDENMQVDRSFSNAFQVNSNGSWEEIGTTSALTIPTNGYLAVYLSNQSRGIGCYECTDVNFDQLVIKLQKSNQLEENHYYPFGLPMAGLSSAAENNTKRQRHKYQSNEYIKEAGLNWMDFNARQYDPQIGRFLGVDPLASSGGQDMYSPYAAMGNAPESMIDPNGEMFDPALSQFATSGNGNENSGLNSTRLPGLGIKKNEYDYADIKRGGGGNSVSSDGASGETEQLTQQQMVDKASEQVGTTAYFEDRVFMSWGVMLPELEVVNHKPNFWAWGDAVKSQTGANSPLGDGFDAYAYNKAMDNPYFRASELGYMPPMGTVHDALETGGALPVVGEIFDIANGVYYSIEGDHKNAAWAYASAIPLAGNFVTGAKWAKKAYKVYEGVNSSGVIKYVGITNRNPVKRWTEHIAKGGGKEMLNWRVVNGAENLTKNQARIIEQTVINQHGLGNLYNKINSIAPHRWGLFGVKP